MAESQPRRRLAPEERRELLLDAAEHAFATTGYAQLGLADVAAAVVALLLSAARRAAWPYMWAGRMPRARPDPMMTVPRAVVAMVRGFVVMCSGLPGSRSSRAGGERQGCVKRSRASP